MNIYEVLRTKPHSERHLARYVKFIQSRQPREGRLEKHHICPKASDLFPQYKSFRDHSWNRISLTYREHYIAHLLLWKVYGGSQSVALQHMTRGMTRKSRLYESIRAAGYTHTEETKMKMRGRRLSEEHKAKLKAGSAGNKNNVGRVLTDDHKAKLSAKFTGIKKGPMPEATKEKLRQSRLLRNAICTIRPERV
jgi:hypothetical protein